MPLTFDFPLDTLKNYRGINPKPADHDVYWHAALTQMQATDPDLKRIPAQFQSPFADCFHLYFTGVGGARIHAQLLQPKIATEPGPAVLQFHGYAGHCGDWVSKLPYAALGYTVVAMDCRGQGGRSEDVSRVSGNTCRGHIVRGLSDALDGQPERLYYRQVFLDTAQLAGIVMGMDCADASCVAAVGESQGGALAVACAALEPRIKLAAPVFPFLSDYQRVWEMDMAKDAYQELRDWFRLFDPQHQRQAEVFTQLGYIDIQHLANRVQAKTLWSIGLADTVCPPSTQFAAYNKIEAPKSMKIFPDFAHETLPGAADETFTALLRLGR